MTEDVISEWIEEIEDEFNSDPGVNEYLEVVEQAEISSKRVETLNQISGHEDRSLTLTSGSSNAELG